MSAIITVSRAATNGFSCVLRDGCRLVRESKILYERIFPGDILVYEPPTRVMKLVVSVTNEELAGDGGTRGTEHVTVVWSEMSQDSRR